MNEAILIKDRVDKKIRDIYDVQKVERQFSTYLKLHSGNRHYKSPKETNARLVSEEIYRKVILEN